MSGAAKAMRYRNKSEEVRIIAEQMRSPQARRFLLGVADDYVLLAEAAERCHREARDESSK